MKTHREFFAALAKCRNGWQLILGHAAPAIRRGPLYSSGCPITAVVYELTGADYRSTSYPMAAESIGLPLELAHRIADAADHIDKEPRLRKRILTALGLEERNGN